MEPLNVVIDNWQTNSWFETWVPIIIAVIALATSVISLYLTKVQFRKSSRPFICAMSYANLENKQLPSLVAYRITNNPANIFSSRVIIQLNNEKLLDHQEKDFVRYNTSDSEWFFQVGKQMFDKIIENYSNNPELRRIIKLEYSALDGGKKYNFSLIQKFVSEDNQWKDIKVNGN